MQNKQHRTQNIIVLLILAAISLTMLSGDNSILSRAGQARDKTKETQKDEEVKVAVLESYDDYANLDIDKLLSNLNEIKDITVTPTKENEKNIFPVTVETGYTSEQTLPAKDTFRVMDIDSRGNMTLIGAMTSSDPKIYFRGALGYNNAVYTLNKKCSDLYKDTSKGITARSIKVEDITSKFNDTGNGKITTYINGQVGTETEDGSLTTGTYITNIDKKNKTVTYKTRTNYPDIFQYEAGGLIDSTATSGVIGQSDTYSGYNGLTTLTNKTPIPTSLTVPYTYYNTTHAAGDFKDSAKAEAYKNMFFGTGTHYWLASRCIFCSSDDAFFRLRYVNISSLDANSLYVSNVSTYSNRYRVCPVVYLPSSVEVEISPSTDKSTYHKTVPHEVK